MKDGRELGEIAAYNSAYAVALARDEEAGTERDQTGQFTDQAWGALQIRQAFALESIAESLSELLRRGAGR